MSDVLSSDVYGLTKTTNELQKRFMEDVSADTLVMSTYGYLNEKLTNNLQQAIIAAGEWGNEAFPIRAKFDKTILTDAITYDISNINAVPATMDIMLEFIIDELDDIINKEGKMVIDRDTPIEIGDYEFHLDYDLIVTRQVLANRGTFYTARYDMNIINGLSDLTSPFLQPPIKIVKNNDNFLFIYCTIRQIKIDKQYQKIISNNVLENKTVDFEFDEQLAGFDVRVENPDGSMDYLTPIYEGMPYDITDKFCYYNYLDTNTIRIKFDKDYYNPALNSVIDIIVYYTEGKDGIFTYSDDIIVSIQCKNSGKTISSLITPIKGSVNGLDRKSIDEIKQIIPKEILSRKNIICNKDLENFFNGIDSDNRLVFHKRTDNQIMRLYYAYLLAKDSNDNIIPTNTIDIMISDSDFEDSKDNDRYVIKPGSTIIYNPKNYKYGKVMNGKYTPKAGDFVYSSPFTMVLNKNPLSSSYYLDVIDMDYNLKFNYINQDSFVQFISTYFTIHKNYLEDNNYKITMNITQNVNIDEGLVERGPDGEITGYKIKVALVLKTDDTHSYYILGQITDFDPSTYTYTVLFEIESDGIIDKNNNIKLNNFFVGGSDKEIMNIYTAPISDFSVYVYGKFDKEYGRFDNDAVVTGMDEYTLCDIFKPINNVQLYYNYSNTIKSTVDISGNKDPKHGYNYKICGVPLIRKSYIEDVDRCDSCINDIQYRKLFIDKALSTLENSFEIDLKFYNTYGPSQTFLIGYEGEQLDRTNLTLNFRIKLLTGADANIIDKIIISIRDYIEDINTITDSIHMSNLITYIQDNYKSEIQFIEFIGINKYNALLQYIEKEDTSDNIDMVPEFLNVNLSNDIDPDVNITVV